MPQINLSFIHIVMPVSFAKQIINSHKKLISNLVYNVATAPHWYSAVVTGIKYVDHYLKYNI